MFIKVLIKFSLRAIEFGYVILSQINLTVQSKHLCLAKNRKFIYSQTVTIDDKFLG